MSINSTIQNHCGAARGSGQRVFSYVYFSRQKPTASSEKKRYFEGIALNAEVISKLRSVTFSCSADEFLE